VGAEEGSWLKRQYPPQRRDQRADVFVSAQVLGSLVDEEVSAKQPPLLRLEKANVIHTVTGRRNHLEGMMGCIHLFHQRPDLNVAWLSQNESAVGFQVGKVGQDRNGLGRG
jgi:hypothetical protein